MKRSIRLRGISGQYKGRVWQAPDLLRAGRLASLEIVLDDSSVSRKHAEVRAAADGGWAVRDLGSTNGTYVNGQRVLPDEDVPLKTRDLIQFGKVAMLVELADAPLSDGPPSDQLVLTASLPAADRRPKSPALSFDRDHMPRAGEQLFALLRAGHHLVHLQNEDTLLDSILNDAVSVLDAQQGAVVLADADTPDAGLRLKTWAVGAKDAPSRYPFSKKLAQKAFAAGASMLFSNARDEGEQLTQSIADGAMGSVICALLRTPRRKIGILHIDRSVFQEKFTEADLALADALAAHVSVGIECSLLLRRQQDLFQKTIMMLANAVELKDEYTGGHTQRVTRYATLLGQKLGLPADQLEWLKFGTPLHDIGKIGIPDAILRKPGRLTPQEFAVMQTHTTLGAEYLNGVAELSSIVPIVRSHHERWDGTGYPDRLKREEIPLLARIVSVCDTFDAMTSNRPYHEGKRGKPPEVAFHEVSRQAGRQFDPDAAAAFLSIRDEVTRALYELMPEAVPIPETGPPTLNGITAPTPPPILTGEPLTGDSLADVGELS